MAKDKMRNGIGWYGFIGEITTSTTDVEAVDDPVCLWFYILSQRQGRSKLMGTIPKLHEYLLSLDFLNAKSSREYVGTRTTNPAMYLEETVPTWSRMASLGEISAALEVFKEKVCIPEFPARFSPPFWLGQAALQAIYKVLNSYLLNNMSEEVLSEVNNMLFDVWAHLIAVGPGSSHLEMMDIILKNERYPLWKHMKALREEDLKLLITTLKTDFVYEEDVSSDHYATLMETHIDKIFRSILTGTQFYEAQRELLELQLYYLSRMNHVPPHIGPRLSHLCFLICQKYEHENPYLGLDDWVLMRHHLQAIKAVVTDWTFTVASEAQYRGPITLEKIFQAAIIDNMLEVLFKDFMALLVTICNHGNSKKCKRLFDVYQTSLFEQIDIGNMEVQPDWIFDQCISTLIQVVGTNAIETHIEHMIIKAVQDCLLKFTDLNDSKKEKWHKLLENCVVSGRYLLVLEAARLLDLEELGDVFNWKEYLSKGRLLIDIISDLPKSFIQDDEDTSLDNTVESYAAFLLVLLTQINSQEVLSRLKENCHNCVIKSLSKDPLIRARIAEVCLQQNVIDTKDLNFLREMLFCVDKLLKDDDCLTINEMLSSVVQSLLTSCLDTFREKGYIPVDFNSMLMSITLTCVSGDGYIQTERTGPPYDIYLLLYNNVILQFIRLHQSNGTLRLVSSIVPQVIELIKEGLQQGTCITRSVSFLQWLGMSCPETVSAYCADIMELFLDWECYSQTHCLVSALYPVDSLSVVQRVPDMFERLKSAAQSDRQTILAVLRLVVDNHAERILTSLWVCTDMRQRPLILEIIHRVAQHSPGVVFGCYTQLIDDTKFPAASLKHRAPILTILAHNSEEVTKKTVDFLMTHVINKDNDESLAAIETLEPLLKQSHTCLLKHKQKLRTVGKTSSCPRVKEICHQLVPDIQNKGPKTVSKGSKQEIKEAGSDKLMIKKVVIQNKAIKSRKISQTSVRTVASKQLLDDSGALQPVDRHHFNSEDDAKHSKSVIKSEVNCDKELAVKKSDIMKEKEVEILKSSPRFDACVINDGKENKKADSANTNLIALREAKTLSSFGLSECNPVQYVDKDNNIENHRSSSGVSFISEVTNNQEQRDNHSNVDSSGTNSEVHKRCWESPHMNRDLSVFPSSVEKVRTDMEDSLIKGDNLNGAEMELAPVYIIFHQSCLDQVGMLRRHLRMAGYECLVDAGQTGRGDREMHAGIHGAKVVIICLTNKFLSSSECCSEVSAALQLSKPTIPLVLEMLLTPPTSLLNNQLVIRFYTKPGEVKVIMGFWVEHKFQQLLMQLNYLRILPDERLITKAYENWWLPRQHTSDEEITENINASQVTVPCLPTVFISYNWGKQHQVIDLYKQLTNNGFSCWLGVYQMSGSESLYNKITQGLQGCRVVLACVTKKYTRAENCQQEVRLAHSLKRPIIPLLLEEVTWAAEDDIGKILNQYDCIKLYKNEPDNDTFGKLWQKQFDELVLKLQSHVPKEKKSPVQDETFDNENLEVQKAVAVKSSDSIYMDKSKMMSGPGRTVKIDIETVKMEKLDSLEFRTNALQKSASMFEIEKMSNMVVAAPNKTGKSKTDDDLIVKKSIPEGVIVDEMGYTVKSSRSKSCVIL